MNSIKAVVSEAIEGQEEYHIMVITVYSFNWPILFHWYQALSEIEPEKFVHLFAIRCGWEMVLWRHINKVPLEPQKILDLHVQKLLFECYKTYNY